jgi:hypothetical protein
MFGGVIFNLSPFSVFYLWDFGCIFLLWLQSVRWRQRSLGCLLDPLCTRLEYVAVLLLAWSYFELVAAGRCYNGAAARRTSRTSILDWDLHFVSGGRSSYGVNATNLGHSVFTMDIDPLSETCNSGFVRIWPLYSPLDVATRPEVWKNCSQVAQVKVSFFNV